ncbi:nuclear transport factor 2 family protein [Woeseia oceani]|nr:nuclear transport factor 2 family protein [Woeseia oceani]
MSLNSATRVALEDLLTEFAWRVDHGHGDRVHELFIEVGSISAPGLTLNSRNEIASAFGQRAADANRVSRHLWSNPRFEELDSHRVRVVTVVQTFFHTMQEGEQTPVPNNNFVVGDSTDVIRRDDDGCWRFESRQLQVLFAPGS